MFGARGFTACTRLRSSSWAGSRLGLRLSTCLGGLLMGLQKSGHDVSAPGKPVCDLGLQASWPRAQHVAHFATEVLVQRAVDGS